MARSLPEHRVPGVCISVSGFLPFLVGLAIVVTSNSFHDSKAMKAVGPALLALGCVCILGGFLYQFIAHKLYKRNVAQRQEVNGIKVDSVGRRPVSASSSRSSLYAEGTVEDFTKIDISPVHKSSSVHKSRPQSAPKSKTGRASRKNVSVNPKIDSSHGKVPTRNFSRSNQVIETKRRKSTDDQSPSESAAMFRVDTAATCIIMPDDATSSDFSARGRSKRRNSPNNPPHVITVTPDIHVTPATPNLKVAATSAPVITRGESFTVPPFSRHPADSTGGGAVTLDIGQLCKIIYSHSPEDETGNCAVDTQNTLDFAIPGSTTLLQASSC